MNAVQLLADLRARGIRVRAEDGRIKWTAPKGALCSLDIDFLTENKSAILALLVRPTPADVANALRWAAWLYWPTIVAESGLEVKGGRSGWVAFVESCSAGDLDEVRRVAGWPECEPPGDEVGEVSQLALLGVTE